MALLNFDFRFIEVTHELYALRQYITSIEQQLPDLIKTEEKKAYENLKKNGYENDEAELQIMRQQLDNLIEDTLPKYFWGQILVTLWAIFESGIYEIASEMKKQKGLEIGISDINGDVLNRVNKYFNHIINLPIKTRTKSWQRLRMLYVLRNAIAHANGRLDYVKSKKDVRKIKNWVGSDIGISETNGNILFNSEFVKETHFTIFNLLNELIEMVKRLYPKQLFGIVNNTNA